MATCADSHESEGRALREQLPERDYLLAGRDTILLYLKQFDLTQWSKRQLTWTTVRGWARWHGFPLTPGTRRGRDCTSDNDDARDHGVVAQPALQRAPERVFRERPRG
jgi:hypothetical protein